MDVLRQKEPKFPLPSSANVYDPYYYGKTLFCFLDSLPIQIQYFLQKEVLPEKSVILLNVQKDIGSTSETIPFSPKITSRVLLGKHRFETSSEER